MSTTVYVSHDDGSLEVCDFESEAEASEFARRMSRESEPVEIDLADLFQRIERATGRRFVPDGGK